MPTKGQNKAYDRRRMRRRERRNGRWGLTKMLGKLASYWR